MEQNRFDTFARIRQIGSRSTALLLLGVAMSVPARADAPFATTQLHSTSMNFARGVRNIGMGATGTADFGGFPTGHFNPASLAWADAVAVGYSQQDWPFAIGLSDTRISAGWQPGPDDAVNIWRFGGLLGYSTMSMGPQIERTIYFPEGTGQTFDVDDDYTSISVAAQWKRTHFALGAGGAAKWLSERVGSGHFTAWAFDIGAIAVAPLVRSGYQFRPRAGVAMTNLDDHSDVDIIGEQRWALGLDMASPPLAVGTGKWRREVSVLALSIDYDRFLRKVVPDDDRWALGWEISLLEMVQVRYGLYNRSIHGEYDKPSTYGFGLGWDFGIWLFQFDYAHMSQDFPQLAEDLDEDVYGIAAGWRMSSRGSIAGEDR